MEITQTQLLALCVLVFIAGMLTGGQIVCLMHMRHFKKMRDKNDREDIEYQS